MKDRPVTNPTSPELPEARTFLTERELCEQFMHCSTRAFRQRSPETRPPAVRISPHRRLYALDEVLSWLANLPRVK